MKLLLKPATAPKISKLHQISLTKEPSTFLDVSEKYLRYKKSASLPNKLTSKSKLQRLMRIYKVLSEGKVSSASQNKSKSKSKFLERNSIKQASNHYQDSTNKINSNKNQYMSAQFAAAVQNNNTKRLSLHTPQVSQEKQNPSHFLMALIDKLEEITRCRMDTIFLSLYQTFYEEMRPNCPDKDSRGNNHLLFGKVFRLIDVCHSRKYQLKEKQVKKMYARIQEGKSQLVAEVNRSKVQLTVLNKKIQEISAKLYEADARLITIDRIRDSMRSIGTGIVQQPSKKSNYRFFNLGVQTSFDAISSDENPNSETIFSEETPTPNHKQPELSRVKLIKRIRELECKEKEVISVLCLLKKEGVNIEKAYTQIVQAALDQSQEGNYDGNPQSEQNSIVIANLLYRKPSRQPKLLYSSDSSQYADESIISSIEAMSFNYEDKELEAENFSARRQYKCKKQMDPVLRGKLQLDFREIYDESDDADFATV